MGGACSTNGVKRNACRILMEKTEGKKPLERPRQGRVDNIKRSIQRQVGVVWTALI
jgi:hypothetical protein